MDLFLFVIGFLGTIASLVMLVISLIRKKPKKISMIALAICFVLTMTGLTMDGPEEQETQSHDIAQTTAEPTSEPTPEATPKSTPEPEEEMTFQEECEKNAEEYPAKPGAVLYTKGEHHFTGMEYYFKGEILKFDIIENNVGDPSIWLVKNDNGYVMPIQHEEFEAEIGDVIEVWGTLSGDGYSNAEGINNVVGQTGSMHAMIIKVNGENQ